MPAPRGAALRLSLLRQMQSRGGWRGPRRHALRCGAPSHHRPCRRACTQAPAAGGCSGRRSQGNQSMGPPGKPSSWAARSDAAARAPRLAGPWSRPAALLGAAGAAWRWARAEVVSTKTQYPRHRAWLAVVQAQSTHECTPRHTHTWSSQSGGTRRRGRAAGTQRQEASTSPQQAPRCKRGGDEMKQSSRAAQRPRGASAWAAGRQAGRDARGGGAGRLTARPRAPRPTRCPLRRGRRARAAGSCRCRQPPPPRPACGCTGSRRSARTAA